MGTEPRGKLNRRSKEIQMILDGISRRGTDPNLDRESSVLLLVLSQRTLDLSSAVSRRHSRQVLAA